MLKKRQTAIWRLLCWVNAPLRNNSALVRIEGKRVSICGVIALLSMGTWNDKASVILGLGHVTELLYSFFCLFFFSRTAQPSKPMRQRRDGAHRAEPSVVCALHQVFQETFLSDLPAEQCHLQHRKTNKEKQTMFLQPCM